MARAATSPGGGVTKDRLVVDKVKGLTIVRVKAVLTGSPVEANELVRRAGGKACLVAGSNAAVLQHALVKVWKVTIKDACGLLVLQIAVLWDGTGSAQGRIDRVSD
jgi:hypothetical protein